MKYLVTGGAGFIGSNLVNQLIEDGHEVVIDNLSTGKQENILVKPSSTALIYQAKNWPALINSQISDIVRVFHLAALARVQPSIKNPHLYHEHNVNATLNLLIAAHDMGVRRFVYSASSSAYGDTDVLHR